jgi:hypothetical protein
MNNHQLGTMPGGRGPEKLREAQVVANKRCDLASAPGKDDRLLSGGVVVPFLAG